MRCLYVLYLLELGNSIVNLLYNSHSYVLSSLLFISTTMYVQNFVRPVFPSLLVINLVYSRGTRLVRAYLRSPETLPSPLLGFLARVVRAGSRVCFLARSASRLCFYVIRLLCTDRTYSPLITLALKSSKACVSSIFSSLS